MSIVFTCFHWCFDRFINKLDSLITNLERKQGDINNIYSSGAVEGYDDQCLPSTSHAISISPDDSHVAILFCIVVFGASAIASIMHNRTEAGKGFDDQLQGGYEIVRARMSNCARSLAMCGLNFSVR